MSTGESSAKIGFEESLGVHVIDSGRCVGCGACVVVCPFACLEYRNGKPVLVKECKVCGICPKVCPSYGQSQSELERFVFGKERGIEEEFGVHRRLAVAQALDKKIMNVSQDGGLVTALLVFGLENKLIDGAVVSGVSKEKPSLPVPDLATSPKEILECSGTRYFCSPNILILPEAIKQEKTSVAFVGTPCQVRAVRRIQKAGLKLAVRVKYLIGLMCSECFTYEGLMEKHLRETLGISLEAIKKVNIKGKMLVTTDAGVHAIPLAETKQYARENCGSCNDFSSELADISAGGLGMNGWTFAIVRTQMGEELFDAAEKADFIRTKDAKEEPNAITLLSRLSRKKRQNAVLWRAGKTHE